MKNNFWLELKKPTLALAPMAGITDSAFREMCRRYGADVVYSEMASVSALFFKPAKTLELVKFSEKERPYVVQLFGKDPAHFAKAAQIITEQVKPDGIDINFGCPAKKVFGHGSGCALMPQKKLAREIISSVCENTSLPVSIKIRAGVKNKSVTYPASSADKRGTLPGTLPDGDTFPETNALEFIENTKDLPYSAVMVHGRTYEGGFSGPVDFSLIEEIKKVIPGKIVLGNGGINSAEEAVEVLKNYPLLDGLGIARGTWGRPYIFNEIKSALSCIGTRHCLVPMETGMDYDFERVKKIMLEHAKLIYADKGETGKFEMRKHLAWYVKGFPGAAELRRHLVMAESLEEIEEILRTTD